MLMPADCYQCHKVVEIHETRYIHRHFFCGEICVKEYEKTHPPEGKVEPHYAEDGAD